MKFECSSYIRHSSHEESNILETSSICAHQDLSGIGESSVDPNKGSVPAYSSRGPCYVDSGSGLETRLQPVITAATGLGKSEGVCRLENYTIWFNMHVT